MLVVVVRNVSHLSVASVANEEAKIIHQHRPNNIICTDPLGLYIIICTLRPSHLRNRYRSTMRRPQYELHVDDVSFLYCIYVIPVLLRFYVYAQVQAIAFRGQIMALCCLGVVFDIAWDERCSLSRPTMRSRCTASGSFITRRLIKHSNLFSHVRGRTRRRRLRSADNAHTHTHTDGVAYNNVCCCVCVCNVSRRRREQQETGTRPFYEDRSTAMRTRLFVVFRGRLHLPRRCRVLEAGSCLCRYQSTNAQQPDLVDTVWFI